MKSYPPEKIRNIAIIGHGTTGKTTLCEAILFKAGAISRQGRVEDGNTVSDFDAEEINRKYSVYASLLSFEYKDYKFNLIDTPGYVDFIGEAISAIRIADGLICAVDAVSGYGVGLERLWSYAEKYELPRIMVINKLDKNQADFYKVVETLRKKFGRHLIPLELPQGSGSNFSKTHTLLKKDIPEELKLEFSNYYEMLIEATAEIDDTILNEYLEGKEIPPQELSQTLRQGINAGKIIPIITASATKGIGIEELMAACIQYLPPANEKEAKSIEGESRKAEPGQPFSAFVFKTVSEPHIGTLNYIRSYSGEIKPGATVFNVNKQKEERIGQIIALQGKNRQELTILSSGDISVLPKLKTTGTGDTLCDSSKKITFHLTEYPDPVVSLAVRPKSKADQEKIGLGLGTFTHEDPTFKMNYSTETKETVISGMGDLHLEVVLSRLRTRYGVEIETGEPRIPYKETIRSKAKAQGKYKKQTGGRGQYGDTWLEIEPLSRGGGFEFVDKIFGGAIPKSYIPSVEKGIREAMEGGVIAGYPVVDVKVTLYDGSYHEVDSSDMAFKIAGSLGFKKSFAEAKPVILEPIVEITVLAPPEYIGEVSGDLNKRRAKILSIETDKVVAIVPQAEIATYVRDLRSFTHGAGTFTLKFSHYEEVLPQTQQRLTGIYQKQKEAGELR